MRVDALPARPALVPAEPAMLPARPAPPPHAQGSNRAIALHFCMLSDPSRQGQLATWPGSHGTGTGPSLPLSVSTTAEQLASSPSPKVQQQRATHVARCDLLPVQSPAMWRGMVSHTRNPAKFRCRLVDRSRSDGPTAKSKKPHKRSRQIVCAIRDLGRRRRDRDTLRGWLTSDNNSVIGEIQARRRQIASRTKTIVFVQKRDLRGEPLLQSSACMIRSMSLRR